MPIWRRLECASSKLREAPLHLFKLMPLYNHFPAQHTCRRALTANFVALTNIWWFYQIHWHEHLDPSHTHLKDSNPSVSYVVKVDGPIVWIVLACSAVVIISVPVDAPILGGLERGVVRDIVSTELAVNSAHSARWNGRATQHSVLAVGGTDKGDVVLRPVIRAQWLREIVHPRRERERKKERELISLHVI